MKVELLSHWGDDLEVVNNARVSFDKKSEWEWGPCPDAVNGQCPSCNEDSGMPGGCFLPHERLKPADAHLIGYLARGCTSGRWDELIEEVAQIAWDKAASEGRAYRDELEAILKHVKRMPEHWAPFTNGIGMKFRITAPIPIMRQVFKHKVGSVESEVSRRYVDDEPEVFYPEFRAKAENVKQGSGGLMDKASAFEANVAYGAAVAHALEAYDDLLTLGVCPEQARFVLPQGTMTTAIVSNSLYGWARFFNQRSDRTHAQGEVADIADMVAASAEPLFPVSWKALTA